jgi:NADPH:quinone reductase-like Zn-dependent oxidoreductase
MPANSAVWLRKKNSGRLAVGPAPYPHPREHEIVVRNHAVAVNPADWIIAIMGGLICPWLTYPAVLGSDAAGEVVEAGTAVTRFRVGDRVLGHAVGIEKNRNAAAEGAFQAYPVLLDHMSTPIPDHISYEQAAVLPLGVSTAACGLFQKDLLGLRLPAGHAPPAGETVLVWGGSTSVGSNAIQLAVAAGYDVITTASPRLLPPWPPRCVPPINGSPAAGCCLTWSSAVTRKNSTWCSLQVIGHRCRFWLRGRPGASQRSQARRFSTQGQ